MKGWYAVECDVCLTDTWDGAVCATCTRFFCPECWQRHKRRGHQKARESAYETVGRRLDIAQGILVTLAAAALVWFTLAMLFVRL